jgi:ribosome-associated protein
MQEISFTLQGEFITLDSLLKATGLCTSGGVAKLMVSEGRVKVDGQVELRKTCKIRAGQRVRYADAEIAVSAVNAKA